MFVHRSRTGGQRRRGTTIAREDGWSHKIIALELGGLGCRSASGIMRYYGITASVSWVVHIAMLALLRQSFSGCHPSDRPPTHLGGLGRVGGRAKRLEEHNPIKIASRWNPEHDAQRGFL